MPRLQANRVTRVVALCRGRGDREDRRACQDHPMKHAHVMALSKFRAAQCRAYWICWCTARSRRRPLLSASWNEVIAGTMWKAKHGDPSYGLLKRIGCATCRHDCRDSCVGLGARQMPHEANIIALAGFVQQGVAVDCKPIAGSPNMDGQGRSRLSPTPPDCSPASPRPARRRALRAAPRGPPALSCPP
jgi:hypothetical protein